MSDNEVQENEGKCHADIKLCCPPGVRIFSFCPIKYNSIWNQYICKQFDIIKDKDKA